MTLRPPHLVRSWRLTALAAAGFLGCEPPHLIPADDRPYADGFSTAARAGGITLIASRNDWNQRALAPVTTAMWVALVNERQPTAENAAAAPVDVVRPRFDLVDERGQVYSALPPGEVVSRLFGPEAAKSTPPTGRPAGENPEPASPADAPSAAPPAAREPPAPAVPEIQQTPDVTSADGASQIRLVSGHAVVPVTPHGSSGPVVRSGPVYRGGYWGPYWGPYGLYGGFYGPYFSFGYPGFLWGNYAWEGSDGPRYPRPFGAEALLEAALRETRLDPQHRTGGLVFFDPVWNARLVTLRYNAGIPEEPLVLSARFEVSR